MNILELDEHLNANIDLAGMGPLKIVQVAVRRWKDGRVVRERFYHK